VTLPEFTPDEIEHLLARPVRARVGGEERAAFARRRVLITGAGGSIGSAIARQLASADVAALTLVDHGELALFAIEHELAHAHAAAPVSIALADVVHAAAMRRIIGEARPDVVFHAAAYKHVTMAERAPASAAAVNVLGAVHAAEAAEARGARFVLISSDKAADPTSVMGASKRLAERLVLAMASPTFHPIVVRFGNVLGSSGSVLPIMRARVRAGQPIPITDPDASRYFMSPGEAVALVLRAEMIGRGGEIFWLEMGRPVVMAELAARLLELEAAAGFAPVPIEIIGLRAGEKKNEILADPRLTFERTVDRRIRVARDTRLTRSAADTILGRLRRAAVRADDRAILRVLTDAVDGFVPSEQAMERARRSRMPAAGSHTRRRRHAA
jgi:FlaA1/EpsC-like NDP-sugar epimerase